MSDMIRHLRGPHLSIGPLVAISLTLILATTVAAAPSGQTPRDARAAPAALLPAWDGGIDLYRDGVFTTQKSWLWCTAAGIQIVRNIIERDNDHSTSAQRR